MQLGTPRTIHPRLTAEHAARHRTRRRRAGRILDRDGRALVQPSARSSASVSSAQGPATRTRPRDALAAPRSTSTPAPARRRRAAPAPKAVRRGPHAAPGRLRRASRAELDGSAASLTARHGAAGADHDVRPRAARRPSARRPPSRSRSPTGARAWRRQSANGGCRPLFDEQLAGTASRRVVIRDARPATRRDAADAGPGARRRRSHDARPSTSQTGGRGGAGRPTRKAALVAVQPSTGDILAVANRPSDSTSTAR